MNYPSPEYLLSASFALAAGFYVAGLVRSLVVMVLTNVFMLLVVQFLPSPKDK